MSNIINELRNYNAVPRELVFDTSLSDRARFVYIFMACKPEDWQFFLEPMAKDIGYSVDTLRKYINELVESGWLVKGEQQTNKGVFSAVKYTLKATKFTDTEKVRHGENNTQYNSSINNTYCTNKDLDIKESIKEKEDTVISSKKKKSLDWSIVSEQMREVVETWLAYKKEKGKMYKPIGFKTFYKNLCNYSNNNPQVAMQIIEVSMANNYDGIFPLRNNNNNNNYGRETITDKIRRTIENATEFKQRIDANIGKQASLDFGDSDEAW